MRDHPVFENLFERRSIRNYLPTPVEREKLELILEAAIWAPSASNHQPWHFTVIEDQSVIGAFNAKGKEYLVSTGRAPYAERGQDPAYHIFHGAPCIVLVSYEAARTWGKVDSALAAQNFMLAAHALGLGTCYIGMLTPWLESDAAKPLLDKMPLPEGYAPLHFITLGTPGADTPKRPRKEGTIAYL
jgi:nitroreductase